MIRIMRGNRSILTWKISEVNLGRIVSERICKEAIFTLKTR